MQMVGEQRIAAPCQRVWEALNDPETLRASIPGCQSLDKDADDRFSAVVEVKVGPIGARFKGSVSLTDLNPPNGYTLILEGNGGIAGTAKGSAKVSLSEVDGGTLVSYEVDAQVGGRMAQLGGPIIDATAKQLAAKFFTRFGEIVSGVAVTKPALASAAPSIGGAGAPAPVRAAGFRLAWVLATVVAALVGFLLGQGQAPQIPDSSWAGLSIGLLLIVVAAAAFEYGRRSAAPVLMLDSALLRRLLDGDQS